MKNGLTRREFLRFAALAGAAVLSACGTAPSAAAPAPTATARARLLRTPIPATHTPVPATSGPLLATPTTTIPSSPTPSATPTVAQAAATVAKATPTIAQAAAAVPTIRYIAGSSTKLGQLLGETDKQRHQPTLSQTETRYGIQGTDLGYSFENGGRVYFLFGDTLGRLGHALDTIATTDALDPEQGVRLDFLTVGKDYLTVQPPGISMGAFETPNGGIGLVGRMYVSVRTNHAADWSTDRSVLTKFTLPATFQPLRTMSQAPAGKFITMSMHVEEGQGPTPGLPAGGPFVMVWGTGHYRESDAFLSIVPAASFESGKGTLYFAGLTAAGAPAWSGSEADASPILKNGTMGDISVTFCKDLGLWLMTFDSRPPAPRGIQFSYSATPWGPWPSPQTIFDDARDGALGVFIHDPRLKPDDGLAGPVIGQGTANPDAVQGGTYAPYVVERWTRVQGGELNLYYCTSTWNPYVVVLMKSRLKVG